MASSNPWTYRADQEVPSYAVDWSDRTGALIDFSTGYTFEVKLEHSVTGEIEVTKADGITGAATSPNVIVAWGAGELDILPGSYRVHLTARTGTDDRMFKPGDEPHIVIEPKV